MRRCPISIRQPVAVKKLQQGTWYHRVLSALAIDVNAWHSVESLVSKLDSQGEPSNLARNTLTKLVAHGLADRARKPVDSKRKRMRMQFQITVKGVQRLAGAELAVQK